MDVTKEKTDQEILNELEDQLKVEEVLDMAKKRRYTTIVVAGIKEDQVEVMHYAEFGGLLAMGMLDMAKRSIRANMLPDSDDGE